MSSLVVTVPPTIEPCTLVEAKAQARLDSAIDDGLLAGYLLAARQHVETYTGRALLEQTLAMALDFAWPRCRGCLEISLPRPPKISVESITYVDTAGATQTLSPSLYQLTERNGCGLIVAAYGQAWPAVRNQYDAITVTFRAGYGSTPSAVPEPISQAIKLLCSHFYENREPVNVGSQIMEFPMSVRVLLAPYIMEF